MRLALLGCCFVLVDIPVTPEELRASEGQGRARPGAGSASRGRDRVRVLSVFLTVIIPKISTTLLRDSAVPSAPRVSQTLSWTVDV